MATKKSPREKLEAQRESLLAQLSQESTRQAGVVNNLGFGYAMRGYSRLKNLSFTKENDLRDRLQRVEADLSALGWRDPGRPVEPERTEEEKLRHYCDVMGLDYEEEVNNNRLKPVASYNALQAH